VKIHVKNQSRPIGSKGLRALSLRILDDGNLQQELRLSQSWIFDGEKVNSTVKVGEGSPFSGTQVDLVERKGLVPLDVLIRIPGCNRVFSPGSPVEAYVFGSEFSYEDFRFFVPPGEIASSPALFSTCWQVRYDSCIAKHFFDDGSPIPARSEWKVTAGRGKNRTVISSHIQDFAGVAMPKVMLARLNCSTFESTMCLGDVEVTR
jgi:hypothetical protein